MAYDEQLANRIRQSFGARSDITERKMFGGLAFLCQGLMYCGIVGRDLMVRIPPTRVPVALLLRGLPSVLRASKSGIRRTG